jgi:hypothetical protein
MLTSSARACSSRKRRLLPSVLCGFDLMKPASCMLSAQNRSESSEFRVTPSVKPYLGQHFERVLVLILPSGHSRRIFLGSTRDRPIAILT